MFNKYKVLLLNGLVLFVLSSLHFVLSIACLVFVVVQIPCVLFLNSFNVPVSGVPIKKQVRNTILYFVLIILGMLLHNIILA